ncbi:MAG: o-succinylbenzoate synthase [Flavobacteriaceae bacterium]
MLKADYSLYTLDFKRASGTSRGILRQKQTYILRIQSEEVQAYGECNCFRGLSYDDVPEYETQLKWTCENINLGLEELLEKNRKFPSIQFGLEQAFASLDRKGSFELFDTDFYKNQQGISINGLIWMGDRKFMLDQIKEKLNQGFSTIKMKIGAIDFQTELELLGYIRSEYSSDDICLRVDANGAFSPQEALGKLQALAAYDLHSIEQPIRQGQFEEMARLCEESPLDIALDEELIGVIEHREKKNLLELINPAYIILKPALVGGFKGSQQWIDLAERQEIDYWITSALEGNIGLNAIAGWTDTLNSDLDQGLGTGSLYTNNLQSPLEVKKGHLYYNPASKWDMNQLTKLFNK